MQPHRQQPTRHPWDSPGKNTGVGCHFLLQYRKVKSESEVAQSCLTLSDPMDCSLPGSSIHGIFQARVLEWDAIALPSRLIQSPCLSFLSHTANACWLCYSFHTSHPLPMSTSLVSMSLSPLLPCKEILQYHFPRFHICVLEYDIDISLSDLLNAVCRF